MHTYLNRLVWKQHCLRVAIKAHRRRWVSHVICKPKKKTSADKSKGRPDRVQAEGEGGIGQEDSGRSFPPFVRTECTIIPPTTVTGHFLLLEDGRRYVHAVSRPHSHKCSHRVPHPAITPAGHRRAGGLFRPTLPLEGRNHVRELFWSSLLTSFSIVQASPLIGASAAARREELAAVAVRVMRNLP
jgi:hypothetical protein